MNTSVLQTFIGNNVYLYDIDYELKAKKIQRAWKRCKTNSEYKMYHKILNNKLNHLCENNNRIIQDMDTNHNLD